jgi:hypothetical protein
MKHSNTHSSVRRAQSCATDAAQAARELHAEVVQPEMALVVFFCSSEYDLDALAGEMARLFAGVQLVGCTTAGEIGPAGYREHSLTGASFPAGSFAAVAGLMEDLQHFEIAQAQSLAQGLLGQLERTAPQADAANSFALLLTDGLSIREEAVTSALQGALGSLPLVGGSAGDGLAFGQTHVYANGSFHEDAAVLVLVTTPLPFKIFNTQHFKSTDQRVVVTAADVERRIVSEIDGLPAAERYARLVGVSSTDLSAERFAAHPVVVMIDGMNYVRSIQNANADGTLTFFCAIEEGLVLRTAVGQNLVENLERTFAQLHDAVGPPQLVIGCDCVLRKLEMAKHGLTDRADAVFRENNTVGFNCYGEQYGGVHVNQTLTGVAIGEAIGG